MRTSAPAGAARSASPTVENGLSDDPSAGAADAGPGPGGATKSTAGVISRGLAVWAHHGGVASHAASRGRTKDQSLTGAVWCLPAGHTSDGAPARSDRRRALRQATYVLRGRRPT